nr:carbohydrate-binding module family 20 domain-containing protein [Streptococcus equi]
MVVNNFNTVLGEQLYIVGDVVELGANDNHKALGPIFNAQTQSIAQYPNWFYDVNLPINKTINCHLVKKDSSGKVLWTSPETYTIKTDSKAQTISLKK